MLCFVGVMQSFIMNSHHVFIHIHQGCFAGTGAIVRLPQCQWSKPDGYGKISQCIITTKYSKAKNRVHISWDILYYVSIAPPTHCFTWGRDSMAVILQTIFSNSRSWSLAVWVITFEGLCGCNTVITCPCPKLSAALANPCYLRDRYKWSHKQE